MLPPPLPPVAGWLPCCCRLRPSSAGCCWVLGTDAASWRGQHAQHSAASRSVAQPCKPSASRTARVRVAQQLRCSLCCAPRAAAQVRNHGAVPRIKWEEHRLAVNGAPCCFAGCWMSEQAWDRSGGGPPHRQRPAVLCLRCALIQWQLGAADACRPACVTGLLSTCCIKLAPLRIRRIPKPLRCSSCTVHPLPASLAGLVSTPTTFTMDQLLQLPSVDVTCTLTCAGALPGVPACTSCNAPVVSLGRQQDGRQLDMKHCALHPKLSASFPAAGNRRKEQNMVKQTIGFNWCAVRFTYPPAPGTAAGPP